MHVTTVQSTTTENTGAIVIVCGMDITDQGKLELTTPLRTRMEPDGVITETLDNLDGYLVLNNWPALSEQQRQSIIDVDTLARSNPAIEAGRAAWIEDNQPPEPVPEPRDA